MIRLLVTFGSAMFNISVIFLLNILPIAIRHTAIHLFGPGWHVWYAFHKVWNGYDVNSGNVPQKWWWFYGLIWINRFSKIHTGFLKYFLLVLIRACAVTPTFWFFLKCSHFLVSTRSKEQPVWSKDILFFSFTEQSLWVTLVPINRWSDFFLHLLKGVYVI